MTPAFPPKRINRPVTSGVSCQLNFVLLILIAACGCQQAAHEAGQEAGPSIDQLICEHMAPALASAIRTEIGPAIGDSVRNDLAPAICAAADAGVRGAIDGLAESNDDDDDGLPPRGHIVREISKYATLGVHDAVANIGLTSQTLPSRSELLTMLWTAVALVAVATLMALGLLAAIFVLALAIWRQRLKPNVASATSPRRTMADHEPADTLTRPVFQVEAG